MLPPAKHTNRLNPFLPLCFYSPDVITSLVRVATVAWAACRTQHQHRNSVGSKDKAVSPKHLRTSVLHRRSVPSNTRLTPYFQHHWLLRFSPRRADLVCLIKAKKRILLVACIIAFICTCTYTHMLRNTCMDTLPPTVTEI